MSAATRRAPDKAQDSPKARRDRRQQNARDRYKDFIGQTQSVGIPVCSLEHTWEGHTFGEMTLNPTDGHPNEGSIRLAADAISNCLLVNAQN